MKPLSLSIPKPCTEKWNNFSPTPNGGFCNSCNKVVTDFTTMNDEQIVALLSTSSAHVCGRFRPEQLKTYLPTPPANICPGFTLLRAGAIGLFILLTSKPGNARMLQEKIQVELISKSIEDGEEVSALDQYSTITGTVRDQYDKSPLPGINVYIKGTTEGTVTDANGHFELHADVSERDVLVFTFIGYETKEYKLPNPKNDVLEIDIELYMDVTVLGEVAFNDVYQAPSSGIKNIWNKIKTWF